MIKLSDFNEGDNSIIAKFSSSDGEMGNPKWSSPKQVTLVVTNLPVNKRKIASRHYAVRDFSWAEYENQDFYEERQMFLSESYRMEIIQIL
jgi:hypothetical protein